MGRVLLCVGNRTENPYYLEKIGRRIYSLEELCYSFKEGAFLLGTEILDSRLVNWIDEECHLPKLAQELRSIVNKRGSVSAFVAIIMEYAAYSTEEENHEVEKLLKQNADLTGMQKGKAYADYLLKQNKYEAALSEYDSILQGADGEAAEEQEFFRRIYHNMGTAYAGLFSFEQAASFYEKCLIPENRKEDGICFLAAKRLSMGEEEYVAFLADNPAWFSLSLELEKKIEQVGQQWKHTKEGAEYGRIMSCRKAGNTTEYYDGILQITEGLKEDYRRMTER